MVRSLLLIVMHLSVSLYSQTVSPEIKTIHSSEITETNITHLVKPEETIYSISEVYSVSTDQIKLWNDLKSDTIEIGQLLIIGKNVLTDKPKEFSQVKPSTDEVKIIPREYKTILLSGSITLDGIPDEEAWKKAEVAGNFIQRDPHEGAPVSQKTEVKVLYSNSALYVAAIMYDTHADSILHQLGNRDEGYDLNSDAFKLGLDPYNNRQTSYVFEVSASGVQSEAFDNDISFDAVWESAVHRDSLGWTLEMKIPYSAIRFPATDKQQWAVQFARLIRRSREYDQWALTPKDVQNGTLYWGNLNGIEDIDPPLRLSLTPYVSYYAENAPATDADGNSIYQNSYSYSGGADLKLGLNESFTIDVTLLPDFSQVQSDNKIKNLSAYETFYDEQRPFFKEGTELFSKGNLLYTRRIGKTPTGFYSVEDELVPGESIVKNPDKAKLLNSTKLSGRTQGGLGIGFLNAITDNTYAVIRQSNGDERKVLTEPLSNYNLIILDQQLVNNSNISLVNTNVARNGNNRDANVTLIQGRFENSKHQYQLRGSYSQSHIYEWNEDEIGSPTKNHSTGNKMDGSIDKISGVSWYGLSYGITDQFYDKNDFGYLNTNDISQLHTYYSYNKFNPFWKYFKQGSLTVYTNRTGKLSKNNQLQYFGGGINFFLLFNNNWSLYTQADITPVNGKDYDEPRIEDQYYRTPKSYSGNVYITTNYNKALAFDFGYNIYKAPELNFTGNGFYIIPMIRFSDKFNIKLNNSVQLNNNDLGFAYLNDTYDTSYFGRRDVVTVTNSLSSRYIFKNDMSLTATARHYWSNGVYDQFYRLENNGERTPVSVPEADMHNYDFNSNYVTIDLVYNWQFSPGSSFLITYKNVIYSDTGENVTGYLDNLGKTFSEPQTNSISLKVLYYLDYQYLRKKKT